MVSGDLRARVQSAVRELSYVPNQLASSLASARTHTIGVVIPSLTNGVFADYLRALHDLFVPAGFHVLVVNSRYLAGEEEAAIETILGQRPEAMVIAGIDQTARARRLLEQAGVPVVQTMELAAEPIDINIGFSHHEAGFAATRYLLDFGYRRVGQISARLDPRSRRRIGGYVSAMVSADIEYERMLMTTQRPSTVALGVELFTALMARTRDIEAVFCCNDDLALGAIFECQRRGIRVPEDISIIGFNDLEFSSSCYPTLTSVSTPRYEMGHRAAEIILEIIRGSGDRPTEKRIDVGFTIKERGSTPNREARITR